MVFLDVAWPFAAIALHFVDGFIDEYKAAWSKAESIFSILSKSENFSLENLDNGTHLVRLKIFGADLSKFRKSLQKRNIYITNPTQGGVWLRINPSLNRKKAKEVAGFFMEAFKESAV